MNDLGRLMNEMNTSMQQMIQTMKQMQGLYNSFSKLSPLWKEMYTSFQAEEEQPIEQVNLSHTAGRRHTRHKRAGRSNKKRRTF